MQRSIPRRLASYLAVSTSTSEGFTKPAKQFVSNLRLWQKPGMTNLKILIIASFFVMGCSAQKQAPRLQMLAPDFAIETLESPNPDDLQVLENCDDQIKKALCVSSSEEMGYDPKCSKELVSETQVSSVIKIKNQLPTFHQKVFCHLARIQIQDNIFSIAYATALRSSTERGKFIGTMIGLKPSVINPDIKEGDMYSWKEQLNFGLTDPKDATRTPNPIGPKATEIATDRVAHFATIVHELNHIIDILNQANNKNYDSCDFPENSRFGSCDIDESSSHAFFGVQKLPW